MTAIRFESIDIEAAIKNVANSAGTSPSDGDLAHYVNRVEAYLYLTPGGDDLVAAFKYAATSSPPLKGDVDKMATNFPAELMSVLKARLTAAQDKADKDKAQADAENAKQEVLTKIGNIASTVNTRLEGVNAIINNDLKSRVPAIKSAAATAEIDIDDGLNKQIEAIETAAKGLLQCQTDVAKTSALKTAQTAEKKSLQHFTDANNAMIAINGIETRVNGTAEAAKAKKTKEKESAKKAKKEKVGKFDRFRSSPLGHVIVIVAFVVAVAILFFLYLPFWFQVGAIIVFVSVLGYHAAMWLTGHERRGQNVTAIVTVVVVVVLAIRILMPLAGTGRGSDGSFLPDRSIETPTPTPQVDCWLAENIGTDECPKPTPTPAS